MRIHDYLRQMRASLSRGRHAPRPKGRFPKLRLESLECRDLLAARLTLVGAQTLVASTNVNVSDNNGTTESEMVVDINPANPLNIAGFVHDAANLNQIQLFSSMNGGLTWTRALISNTGPNADGFGVGTRFDPAIKFDANGNLYVAYGHNNPSPAAATLIVARSTNGGASFTQFRAVDFNFGLTSVDKWHLATGPAGPGSSVQAVYVAYTYNVIGGTQRIHVAGSNNGGATFTSPVAIDGNGINGDLFASPGVGPNGELYVVWHNFNDGRIWFDRDLNGLFVGGANFGADVTVRTLNCSMFKRPVPAQPRRGIHTGPVLDVDRSGGPFNGRLYIAFVDRCVGNDTDIFLTTSTNQGANWSALGAIGNVEAASSTDFLPWVAVDQTTGSVNVAYYTTDGAPNNTEVDVRVASSINGGATFVKTKLTARRSRAASASYGGEFLEYIGLAARDGTLHGFWADNRGASQGLFVGDLDSFSASACTRSSGNTLTVTGTAGGDTIFFRRSPVNANFAMVFVNGQLQWAGLGCALGVVIINALAGNDVINIEDAFAGVPITVNAGADNDTVHIAPNTRNLDRINAAVTVNANAGLDTLTVNDQNNNRADVWTLNSGSVGRTGGGSAVINYTGFNNGVIINGGTGATTFNVLGTTGFGGTTLNSGPGVNVVNVRATTGPLTVNTGGGTNSVNVGNIANRLDNIVGVLTVNGQGGSNTLTLNDQGTSGAKTYVIDPFTVLRFGTPATTINYQTITNLVLNGGSGGNVVSVGGTPAGTAVTLNTGANHDVVNVRATTGALTVNTQGGDNTTNVGSAANQLDPIAGPLTINGTGGLFAHTVNLNDQGTSGARTFTLNAAALTRSVGPAINLVGPISLNLNGGSGGNTVNVQGLPSGGALLNTGAGSDTINVGTAANTLNGFGSMRVQGQGGTDQINLNDQGASAARTYTFASPILPNFQAAGTTVFYGTDVEGLTLNGGSGGNTINVRNTQAATPVAVNAGSGDDTVNVGSTSNTLATILGTLTVDGQGGTDELNVNDQAGPTLQDFFLTSSTVQRTGTAVITYAMLEALNIRSSLAGTIGLRVAGTAAGTPVTLTGTGHNFLFIEAGSGTFWITGTDAGTLTGNALGSPITFTGVASLLGGEGDDTFAFADGQTITGFVYGGDGRNALDYSQYTTDVYVNLQTGEATGVPGLIGNINDVTGGSGTDTLVGPDAVNTWYLIDGVSDLLYANGNHVATFSGVDNLTGGLDIDTFVFSDGYQLAGSIDGVGGRNALDYSQYTTDVYVNLQTGAATGAGAGIGNIYDVVGGSGNDILVGNGDNVLVGGDGRDLLIAGFGYSVLDGGLGDDLLVGGTTLYDTDEAALRDIRDGVLLLDAGNAFSNGGNTMLGGDGIDQFFGRIDLDFTDWDPATEVFVEIG